jgi:hypothetical protein
MCKSEIRVHFNRLAALCYGFVIVVGKDKKFCQIGVNN